MVGFFVRQSYGYLCPYASVMMSAPTSRSFSTHAAFPASSTARPFKSSPASSVNFPASSTGDISGRPCLRPVM
eukprot:31419-Pelagococcus_subviridis.AAC.23